jgi:hypothetical protein
MLIFQNVCSWQKHMLEFSHKVYIMIPSLVILFIYLLVNIHLVFTIVEIASDFL